MAFSLRNGWCVSSSYEIGLMEKKEMVDGSRDILICKNEFKGNQIVLREQSGSERLNPKGRYSNNSIHAQTSICVPRAMRWWEKSTKQNMIEIKSTQEFVDTLMHAGDKLVVVDFYSPGCGGCKALHPKICQLAELYPDAMFLSVNYEEHKPMCQCLQIHVLPFFRFYRGAQGRVSSFSCTNSTIKKFKDALAKHGAERCSLGPAKGLEESELISLALNRETSFSYPLRSLMPKDLAIAGETPSSFFAEFEGRSDLAMA